MCIIEWIFLPTKNLPPFCVVVFSNLFSKKIDDTSRVLDEMKWNPRTVNSYPFICHSADNSSYTSCLLLFCALVSSDFFHLIKLVVLQILNTIVLDIISMLVKGIEISMN